jgi:hypothetical protein
VSLFAQTLENVLNPVIAPANVKAPVPVLVDVSFTLSAIICAIYFPYSL